MAKNTRIIVCGPAGAAQIISLFKPIGQLTDCNDLPPGCVASIRATVIREQLAFDLSLGIVDNPTGLGLHAPDSFLILVAKKNTTNEELEECLMQFQELSSFCIVADSFERDDALRFSEYFMGRYARNFVGSISSVDGSLYILDKIAEYLDKKRDEKLPRFFEVIQVFFSRHDFTYNKERCCLFAKLEEPSGVKKIRKILESGESLKVKLARIMLLAASFAKQSSKIQNLYKVLSEISVLHDDPQELQAKLTTCLGTSVKLNFSAAAGTAPNQIAVHPGT